MERKKPKLLIIGHARHGKDTFADHIVRVMDLSFISSSEFVGRECIWEQWGKERYVSFSDMFEDRVNHRKLWFNLIVAYNTPNLARTGEEMMSIHDVYVGMRNPDEFKACMEKKLFDYVIWVDASARLPLEGKDSNQMTADMATIHIDNNGPENMMEIAVFNFQKRLHAEGFEVNYVPTIEEVVDIPFAGITGDHPTIEAGLYGEVIEDVSLRVGEIVEPLVPRNPMIVNPTLEESKKFHEDAQRLGAAAIIERSNKPPKPFVSNMENLVKQGRLAAEDKKLDWKDAPDNSTRVLDHGFIRVLGVMGSDQTIVDSARMSYGRGTKPTSSSKKLINYLVRNGHTSPLEMGEIRFHIRMPIFVMRQWVRHRTANLNEYSGRYSEMVRLFYVPEVNQICLQNKVNKQGSAEPLPEDKAKIVQGFIQGIGNHSFDEYENLLLLGVSRETARMVLPLNTYTEVVWKLDISNLIKFLRLRDDDHAQWEIRQYAIMVAEAVKENFPLVYSAYLEARHSQTFTMDEVRALVTGDPDNLSVSQKQRMVMMRYNIFN